jgi:chemotaxis protein CheX
MMESEYISPFIQGVEELVHTMLQTGCRVDASPSLEDTDVSGVISMAGEINAQLALSFPKRTARRMVAQMLAIDENEVDESILGDGVGEMANIVAGRAKARFGGGAQPLQLSLPSIIIGSHHDISFFRAHDVTILRVQTEMGNFSLRIWFSTPSG